MDESVDGQGDLQVTRSDLVFASGCVLELCKALGRRMIKYHPDFR